jgi:hypothetical protein
MKHGDISLVPIEALFWDEDDPDLTNVFADMHTWSLAHDNCNCEGKCVCDGNGNAVDTRKKKQA